jgi:hypothetical protein
MMIKLKLLNMSLISISKIGNPTKLPVLLFSGCSLINKGLFVIFQKNIGVIKEMFCYAFLAPDRFKWTPVFGLGER